jgi:hypothetical protein
MLLLLKTRHLQGLASDRRWQNDLTTDSVSLAMSALQYGLIGGSRVVVRFSGLVQLLKGFLW